MMRQRSGSIRTVRDSIEVASLQHSEWRAAILVPRGAQGVRYAKKRLGSCSGLKDSPQPDGGRPIAGRSLAHLQT